MAVWAWVSHVTNTPATLDHIRLSNYSLVTVLGQSNVSGQATISIYLLRLFNFPLWSDDKGFRASSIHPPP